MLLCISDLDLEIVYLKGNKNMLISDALSRLSSHNINAINQSEVAGLNITIHDIEVNSTETRLDSIGTLTSKHNVHKHYIMQV